MSLLVQERPQLLWERIGALPISSHVDLPSAQRLTSASLLATLRYVQQKFDDRAAAPETSLGPAA